MRIHRFNARRYFYGGQLISGGASTFPQLMLYNGTTGGQLLLVRDWGLFTSASAVNVTFGTVQGNQGGVPIPVFAGYPGEPQGPAQLTQLLGATNFPNGYNIRLTPAVFGQWIHDYPFTVVPPGWTFYISTNVVNLQLSMSIAWEWCLAEELEPQRLIDANIGILEGQN